MGQIDRATVESHLIDALQHLATAGVVIRHLDHRGTMGVHDRSQLMGTALEVEAMLRQVTEALDDRHPRRRRSQLDRDTAPPQTPADGDASFEVIELPDLVELAKRVDEPD
ncbi:MAG: hypothetical protein EA388_01375 [Nitriliruptor sp.]|nr:MAG: hypothetical protein EA388_01375 [Nitriliruptor sp.]